MSLKIGENIAYLRNQRGLTQEELAKVFLVSNQSVSKWEAGKCCPDIELIPQIACFFDVSIDKLLVGDCAGKLSSNAQSLDKFILQAIEIAQEEQEIYTAILQRRLGISYGKAKKIIDDMCKSGYIIKDESSKYKYLYSGHLGE